MFKKPPLCARHYREPREIYRESAMDLPSRGTASSRQQRLQSQPRACPALRCFRGLPTHRFPETSRQLCREVPDPHFTDTGLGEFGATGWVEPGSGPCPGALGSPGTVRTPLSQARAMCSHQECQRAKLSTSDSKPLAANSLNQSLGITSPKTHTIMDPWSNPQNYPWISGY